MSSTADLPGLQPVLHDLVACVCAPAVALGGADGQIRRSEIQGVFVADVRALGQAILRVNDDEPTPLAHTHEGPAEVRFVGVARALGDGGPDPTVRIDRRRRVSGAGLVEVITLSSTAASPVDVTVTLDVWTDLAGLDLVKADQARGDGPVPTHSRHGLHWRAGGTDVVVAGDHADVCAVAADDRASTGGTAASDHAGATPSGTRLTWPIRLEPGERHELRWSVRAAPAGPVVVAPRAPMEWTRPTVLSDDARLHRWVDRSLDDLQSLRLASPDHPDETFLGAGVPWFLTLFGRDSLWAARMMLPLGTALAGSTLRTLARRQGRAVVPASGEEPGKIIHELRRPGARFAAGHELPAAYYGTVDATMLWISLLHDAWRWGLPPGEVAALLPALRSALGWLSGYADPDGDGFVEYLDHSGRGLANQGWKDSGTAVRFHDGRLAEAPIALCEVQGYAHRAALDAAVVLEAFDQPGASRWRAYAEALNARFRSTFWAEGPLGPYPVLALDRDKRQVTALTSNIGHLLDSGLLNAEETRQVARLLGGAALAGGYGLRTMSTMDKGYDPLSYHCGSIWPHDTAIAIAGLSGRGEHGAAIELAEGLLRAAEAFDFHVPELYSGDSRADLSRPVPYPAACRPQAWSAAAAIAVLGGVLGLAADIPGGTVTAAPILTDASPGTPVTVTQRGVGAKRGAESGAERGVGPRAGLSSASGLGLGSRRRASGTELGPTGSAGPAWGAVTVRGLRAGAARFDLRLDRDGRVTAVGLPPGLRLVTPALASADTGPSASSVAPVSPVPLNTSDRPASA